MTSTASSNAANPSNAPQQSAPSSYASAASANKKASGNPLIASGSHQQPAANVQNQHGKGPMNGRPPITPAIPTVAPTTAVAHGSSNANANANANTNTNTNTNINGGASSHARTSSVTIKAPGGPANFNQNTGNMAAKPNNLPQFGFSDSPVPANSTPNMPSAPIAIPSAGNANRIPSPANSPRPIPISSGGPNNPSGLQANVQKPVFGSHRNDEGERHMRQNLAQSPMNNQHLHGRKDSHHSMHDPGMPPQNNRGGYQSGRGGHRYSYQGPQQPYMNSYGNNRGAPPNRPMGSPYAHHAVPNFAQSPRPVSRNLAAGTMPGNSPAMAAASPSMSQAMPYPQTYHQGPPNYGHGMPPNQFAGGNHFMNPPPFNNPNPYAYSMGPQPPMTGYQGQPQAPVYHQQQQFNPATNTFQPAGSQSMSRQGSAMSHTERPGSSGPPPPAPPGNGPVIASGSHPGSVVQSKAAIVSGTTSSPGQSAFSRPKKSTIVIKTVTGEEVDFKKGFGSGSPAPLAASKTPPAKTPSPAPGVKPAESPADSAAVAKTSEEKKKEFAEAVAKAKAETEAKAKEEAEAKAVAEAKAKAEEEEAKVKAAAEAKAKEEAEAKAAAEAKAKEEAEIKAKAEAEEKARQEAEAAAKAEESQKSAAPAAKPTLAELEAKGFDNMTPEEEELYFNLLDEQDAKREAEQQEITARKKAEEAEAKAKADAERAKNAADEDKKLREAEAEAERLELEKERRQKEREARGETMDIKIALNATIADLRVAPEKETQADPTGSAGSVTNKMASLSLNKNAGIGAVKPASQRQKPAALNLQPLKTSAVEAPQPSAALQSLKSARFLSVMTQDIYPEGIKSPNPAVSAAARGKPAPFRYDLNFMLQFQGACKEPPSMDFQQQVKSLIGEEPGSRSASTKNAPGMSRQPSRAGSNFPAMGSFGSGGPMDRAMPSMGSGAPRFGIQGNAPMPGRPQPNPMGSFPRGSFPGGAGMSRTSSNTGMIPNSPRTGSHRGGGSKRNNPHVTAKRQEKDNAAMPLTQGMEISKLTTSSSGWKPQSLAKKGGSGGEPGLMDPETVQRKVKAALNKMTPEKFERLSNQVLEIASQSKHEKDGRTLRQVIQLVFEKATDEAHWSGMYAKFCRRMLDTMDAEIRDEGILDKNGKVVSGGALFRKYLLNRCQEEFERGWAVNLPPPKEGETKEAALLSDEYYTAAAVKRRGLGLVQFIGELFKLNMLTERIMHECVRKLLDYEGDPDEAEIESLCKLLKTVGQSLDATEKGHAVMNAYFSRIDSMIETENLPSRMKFMLMDVVDLRRAGWSSSADNKGPKTLEEIRVEQDQARAQKEAEAARSQRQGGRAPGGRDNRNFSQGFGQSAPNQIGLDDLRRLKGSANRSSSHNITLGPSLLGSRSNSGRKVGGPGGSLGRSNDDGSRTGTPIQRQSTSNQFALLAAPDDTTSPPSTAASPNLPKATPAPFDAKKAD